MFCTNAFILDFSINGMEAAFMIIFLAWIIYIMSVPTHHPALNLGLAWTGLMYTRPDGFIYIFGLAIGYLLFSPVIEKAQSRKRLIITYIKAMAIVTILYLPWLLWTWHYYGSPIPHTIIAKGLNHWNNLNVFSFADKALTSRFFLGLKSCYFTFIPLGDFGFLAINYSGPIALACAFYWILPFARKEGRAVSFALMIAHFYLSYIASYIAPWYLPSVIFLSIFVLTQILQQAISLISFTKKIVFSVYIAAFILLSINLSLTLATSYQLRLQQEIIETGSRKQIGLWLKEHAKSNKDTVFLEPLGYIGFFSGLKMLDFPGIASNEVIAARKRLLPEDSMAKIIAEINPDWLVLRPSEALTILNQMPEILNRHYREARVFDCSQRIKSLLFIPGRDYLQYDQTFTIFQKK
ncbi:MAG: hypothetical protein PHO70_01610 [Candidatus Omnitrophica bacterium]|nr:hypothetical protein [Candidatus Omnitrophota bacterium]